MSYTIVHDQQQIDFERTNTWNAIVRHCKIGKVVGKGTVFVPAGWMEYEGDGLSSEDLLRAWAAGSYLVSSGGRTWIWPRLH